MANVSKRNMEDYKDKRKHIPVLLNFTSFKVEFDELIKCYEFESIRPTGKIRFRCTTINKIDNTEKSRYTNLTLYKDGSGFYFKIMHKLIRVDGVIRNFLNRFKMGKPARTVVMCPKCRTPLKYIWRDNVNAVYNYMEAITYAGVGDYHIEREYNMEDEGNFDYVYCPNCQYTNTNPKTIKKFRKVPGEQFVDMDNVVDYFEFKHKE